DLFHRLNVIRLRLPPLRERRDDIPGLTRHFLQQSARQLEVEPKRISDLALAQLSRFAFPGNVRQLENICHWLTVMAPAQVIDAKDLPPEVLASTSPGALPDVATAGQSTTGAGPVSPAPVPPAHAAAAASPTTESLLSVHVSDQAGWESGVEVEAGQMLAAGRQDVWEVLTRRFESRLILTALANTRGRRIEAAQKLGIGRNTITRKIQDLGLE
ncbi:MAG TPA: helix-turn-helix domain-containing protein, partial [Burkholderiaceae bacterium]|nr:helix-turn-helix domain-containing protein [Burkholderiaceae bacterium]